MEEELEVLEDLRDLDEHDLNRVSEEDEVKLAELASVGIHL